MPAKKTQTEFLNEAKQRHGDLYDYSLTAYKTFNDPVTIVCAKHGPFQQSPSNHIAGKGCRKCAAEASSLRLRRTASDFVARARAVHKDAYDYSSAEYVGAREKLTIICPRHGPFQQTPGAHLRGTGCPVCGRKSTADSSRLDTREFIHRATQKFGARFDYSNAVYVSSWTPLTIRCHLHGNFQQTPAVHLLTSRHGCPKCGRESAGRFQSARPRGAPVNLLSFEEFIRQSNKTHGERYDYSTVLFKGANRKVEIRCPTHGSFLQNAGAHMRGAGCRKCANERTGVLQRGNLDLFISRSMQVHGSRYDYSQVVYKSARTPVTILCSIHGDFMQTPEKHLKGGCRKCADAELPGAYSKRRFAKADGLAYEAGRLYYAHFTAPDGETFYKVGITKTTSAQRFAGYRGSYGYSVVVLYERPLPLEQAHALERKVLSEFAASHKYLPMRLSARGRRFGGRNECFDRALPEALIREIFPDADTPSLRCDKQQPSDFEEGAP